MSEGGIIRRGTTVKRAGGALGRSRTLVRPDRHVELPKLFQNDDASSTSDSTPIAGAPAAAAAKTRKRKRLPSAWVLFSWATTCCFPGPLLSVCKITGKGPQQAWREKVALCWIVVFFSAIVVFFSLFFNDLFCNPADLNKTVPVGVQGGVVIRGIMYNAEQAKSPYNTLFQFPGINGQFPFGGFDVSTQFNQPPIPACNGINEPYATLRYPCENDNTCLDITQLDQRDGGIYGLKRYDRFGDGVQVDANVAYEWPDVIRRRLTVFNRRVLNLNPYIQQVSPNPNSPIDTLIRRAYALNDATHIFYLNSKEYGPQFACIAEKYKAGMLSQLSMECILTRIIIMVATIIVLGILLARFFMAVIFTWFISNKLSRTPDLSKVDDYYSTKKAPAPPLRNSSADMLEMTPLTKGGMGGVDRATHTRSYIGSKLAGSNVTLSDLDLYTVLLVTCYSEGEASLRTTLESLALTDYSDDRKLLFVVADGLITGKGNAKSTPDLLIDMLEIDPMFPEPRPYSYVAVASGSKQHNMAKVYCGRFNHKSHSIPTLIVVKCGTPEEASAGVKPGNRGKRDSQLILMNFFSRVLLNDRMTPLDFDMFRKIHHVTGVTPDFFEIVLMVDADTKVLPSSMRYMINCMHNDPMIMGLCGETKIENKKQSFMTRIQVFEYYISHHMGKAFESIFGGVTCLPGCFCMYRIKARKSGLWVPILVNPDVTETYSTSNVTTLHAKNLLLLGEDRFLSTMMLRTFPNRKMIFVPKAICKTVVPDDFQTLLSQRRRWINSTIHNLMELVLVNNLCGTFCFSMQFVVLMDLIGTAILPVSIVLTYWLIIKAIAFTKYSDILSFLPTILLAFVLFLPGILVMLTDFKLSRLGWMLIYMLALPIWNLVLPVYAFWHFDDFSWGATRQVAGAGKAKDDHGGDGKESDAASKVPMKRWEEYERAWRQSIRKKKMMQQQQYQQQQAAAFHAQHPHPQHPHGHPHFPDPTGMGMPAGPGAGGYYGNAPAGPGSAGPQYLNYAYGVEDFMYRSETPSMVGFPSAAGSSDDGSLYDVASVSGSEVTLLTGQGGTPGGVGFGGPTPPPK
ncbi:hypothetical protein HK102_006528 [Quaeritorhiza haematococci]|nr:hypothetical protein HK102_006528 [Quaeritorhiza haematococci]